MPSQVELSAIGAPFMCVKDPPTHSSPCAQTAVSTEPPVGPIPGGVVEPITVQALPFQSSTEPLVTPE